MNVMGQRIPEELATPIRHAIARSTAPDYRPATHRSDTINLP
jgi:hypothetical protein